MVCAPTRCIVLDTSRSIFMAGSIQMGVAIDWQRDLYNRTADLDVTYFNPRRTDWDSSWKQEIENHQFYEQVSWELDHLEMCSHVVFVFDPDTTSPITMMELGYVLGRNQNVIGVVCPEGFYRKGNVDIICKRHAVPVLESLDGLELLIRRRFE